MGKGKKGTTAAPGRVAERSETVFVSYAERDRPWAEWVAWHLRQAGLTVDAGAAEWSAGDNAELRRTDAIERADRAVMLYSEAYFARDTAEWTVLTATGTPLVPLRIEEVQPPATLQPYVVFDLVGLDEDAARARLLEAVGVTVRADGRPGYPPGRHRKRPTGPEPRLPGSLPDVWQVPPRNTMFKGREKDLAELRDRLGNHSSSSVQSVHGMGGIGKSTLALEYAHRFAGSYNLVWWIDAEQPNLIGEQMAALGIEAGWCTADVSDSRATAMVRHRLRTEGGWLVIFDNAERPDDLRRFVPQGSGHVLITSRNPGWAGIAGRPSELDIFAREDSVSLLCELVPELAPEPAGALADDLGDLPLAVAQAGALLAESGMPVDTYRRLLASEAAQLLSLGDANGYGASLAAVVRISLERIALEDPAAEDIARVCALLSADPIPTDIFTGAPPQLRGSTESAVHASIGRLGRYGLAKVSGGLLRMHRLTQAIIRDLMTPEQRAAVKARAEQLVAAAYPRDTAFGFVKDPSSWPRWAQLLPHLLALDPTSAQSRLRDMACQAVGYLGSRGDYEAAREFAISLYEAWRAELGPDAELTLKAGGLLVEAYIQQEETTRAEELAVDMCRRLHRVQGPDHQDTVLAGLRLTSLYYRMDRLDKAEDVATQYLARARSVFGEDDELTSELMTAVANVLWRRGEHVEAQKLEQEVLARSVRIRGWDDVRTITVSVNFAETLFSLGFDDQAVTMIEEAVERSRRKLGYDHPQTLFFATRLGTLLAQVKRSSEALDLLRDTLDRSVRVAGPSSTLAIRARVALVEFHIRFGPRGSLGSMVDDLLRCVRASHAFEGFDPPTRELIESLGDLLRQLNRPAQAKSLIARLEKTMREAKLEPPPKWLAP
ncbi:FxSxx-COOH system tetratricopeptide repeat protein [Actinoplanes sp. NPDC049681]|uniref:FxSxx-COOH system tetratricopeptide repeat protein n=1 Tax=Actinoplanes sp. NPDC049681 TaxID=3363905 RepID=UPI0037946A7F